MKKDKKATEEAKQKGEEFEKKKKACLEEIKQVLDKYELAITATYVITPERSYPQIHLLPKAKEDGQTK